jgi:hypothetical protein
MLSKIRGMAVINRSKNSFLVSLSLFFGGLTFSQVSCQILMLSARQLPLIG